MATFTSNSAADTEALGRRFGAQARPGSVLALQGDLGAGKTEFTKGLVAELGGPAVATSPTFTLIHEYPGGRLPVYHFDFFRLEGRERLVRLGLDDYFFGNGVCVIEWADLWPDFIPQNACWIRFQVKSENERVVEWTNRS